MITPAVTRPDSLNGRNESEVVKSVRADREEDIKKSVVEGEGGSQTRARIRSRELISGEGGEGGGGGD